MQPKTRLKPLFLALLLALAVAPSALGQTQMPLSPSATASLITCGPGNDFYTTFGHSAIRITDTALGLDLVYNYGTFDFDTPHFYWQFTRGRLDYCLSRTSFEHFIATYAYEQRAVWEQPLCLTPQETSNLYLMLENNYLPDYRYYRYDFFRDNCATRVRDMIQAAPAHRNLCTELQEAPRRPTYRDLLRPDMRHQLEWWRMGLDILLGLPVDHRCTTDEQMFHPLVMQQILGQATLTGPQGQSPTPLTSSVRQLLPDSRPPLRRSFPPVVAFAALLCLVAIATLMQQRRGWNLAWLDRLLFIVAGLIGLFLIFMWAGTDHWCTAWNLNILWASPLLLLIAIRLGRSPHWALWLQLAMFLLAAVWVVACHLSPALLPIILTLALRTAVLLRQ